MNLSNKHFSASRRWIAVKGSISDLEAMHRDGLKLIGFRSLMGSVILSSLEWSAKQTMWRHKNLIIDASCVIRSLSLESLFDEALTYNPEAYTAIREQHESFRYQAPRHGIDLRGCEIVGIDSDNPRVIYKGRDMGAAYLLGQQAHERLYQQGFIDTNAMRVDNGMMNQVLVKSKTADALDEARQQVDPEALPATY